ncbi:lipopolysaccharide transport periplasmic protein LptA [Schlegelella aquatica]|uniref:lipopolysaccharide transport periplasmic protein LptA n=1 Tax=Caldimonas aquatica TaxID=376175 RepID=UPI003753D043
MQVSCRDEPLLPPPLPDPPAAGAGLCAALALALGAAAVHAERADRYKPLNFTADALRYDHLKQTNVLTGNVVITKGTMTVKAARVEVHQTPSGHQSAVAHAGGGQSAYFRQKRDAVDEYIEGEGQRIEYDGRTDTVRLVGQAVVRRYRGTTLADEVKGQTITYDNLAETFTVQGGEGDGRVRGVLSPRDAGPPAGGAR